MKKILPLILAIAIMLTGCGGKADNEQTLSGEQGKIVNNPEQDEEINEFIIKDEDLISEVDGIKYKTVAIPGMGMSFDIPYDFDSVDTTNPFFINFTSSEEEYENIQISVTKIKNTNVSPMAMEGLYANARNIVAELLTLRTTAGVTLSPAREMISKDPFEKTKLYGDGTVYVPTDKVSMGQAPYFEYEAIPDSAGVYETRKHFIGELNSAHLTWGARSDSTVSGKVYTNFLFGLDNLEEYVIAVVGPETKTATVDKIIKTLGDTLEYGITTSGETITSMRALRFEHGTISIPDWNKKPSDSDVEIVINKDIDSAYLGVTAFVIPNAEQISGFDSAVGITGLIMPGYAKNENDLSTIAYFTEGDNEVVYLDRFEMTEKTEFAELPYKIAFTRVYDAETEYLVGVGYKVSNEEAALKVLDQMLASVTF